MTMTKDIAIETAAKWWASKFCDPQHHRNAANDPVNSLACLVASLGAEGVHTEQRDVFVRQLEVGIRSALNKDDYLLRLGGDYHPDQLLSYAAGLAFIDEMNFPFHTRMEIRKRGADDFSVEVAEGFAKPYVALTPCD